MVEVTHILGFVTRYAHLSSIDVQVGQILERGTQIGTVGSTGRSTGPHLFFEIRLNDKSIDPIVFILKAYQVYNNMQ
jgi:murein DD-endopeptidase MepM/ murein hydrolase activator NlpD